MHEPPLHYQADPRIWAGALLGDTDVSVVRARIQWLNSHGVTHIIDLTTPADACPPYAALLAKHAPGIVRHAFPIRDMGVPSPGCMLAILDTISTIVAGGATVYVHCWGGKGRTGTVIGCWYVRQGMTGADALARIVRVRGDMPGSSPETDAQRAFVIAWREPSATVAAQWHQWRDRARGAMLGLAVGDAVGTTLEFKRPGTFAPLTDMVGGGPFRLPVGAWTDDTSMMLCLAESLMVCGGFDATDQMQRYVRWQDDGYFSVTGRCFDIGSTVLGSLNRFRRNGNPFAGDPHPMSAGNGSLMRLAPIAVRYVADAQLVHYARESSRTTHATATALDACAVMAQLMAVAIRGGSKQDVLALVAQLSADHALHADIQRVVAGSFRREPPDIRGTGYVVQSLEAALWALQKHNDYRSGVLAAANLGEDADTTAAIYGQLAGAIWGESGIPASWRDKILQAHDMTWRADELLGAAWGQLVQA
jgi:ADP-ribosyl-[dinitrogen reductase] hydrolase